MADVRRTTFHRASRRRFTVTNELLLLYFLLAILIAMLVSIFGPTLYLMEHDRAQKTTSSLMERHIRPHPRIEISELEHESIFRTTIKNCRPVENAKCGRYVPDPIPASGKKVQRVALIAPPGDIASALYNRIQNIVHEHNNRQDNSKKDLDIEVHLTSHIPPYGYGKTHGLTKILHVTPQPLLLEVTDTLTSVLDVGETIRSITLADLQTTLRMILRMHCRLSHVAAHTAVDSIDVKELLIDPSRVVAELRQFLIPNDATTDTIEDNDDDNLVLALDDDQGEMVSAELAFGAQILTSVQSVSGRNVIEELDRVLVDELTKTRNLTNWPCLSFWSAADDNNDDNNKKTGLSPRTVRLAKALSPDCNDPYNHCFVQRDKCEFLGDAVCDNK